MTFNDACSRAHSWVGWNALHVKGYTFLISLQMAGTSFVVIKHILENAGRMQSADKLNNCNRVEHWKMKVWEWKKNEEQTHLMHSKHDTDRVPLQTKLLILCVNTCKFHIALKNIFLVNTKLDQYPQLLRFNQSNYICIILFHSNEILFLGIQRFWQRIIRAWSLFVTQCINVVLCFFYNECCK